MSEKKNFWNQVWSAMNGAITFGKIKFSKGDVTSSVHIQALDGRHFMSFDEDGPTNWLYFIKFTRFNFYS